LQDTWQTSRPNELPQNEDLEREINKALNEPLQITTNQTPRTKEIQNVMKTI
jgi:hypothetical protein